jgi:16S rRNA (cytosine1402-N4)-methyltransferase
MTKRSTKHPDAQHTPVMLKETLDFLQCRTGGTYVDGTVGLGGHAQAILEKILPGGSLIGIDRDRESLDKASIRLKDFSPSIRLLHDNFKNLPLILNNLATGKVDGILLDLGISSYQMLAPERGFSFQGSGMLDMRMDRAQRQTAADLLNNLPAEQLADIFYRYGEERMARRIAAAVVRERQSAPIFRCRQLAEIVSRVKGFRARTGIHPATQTFQALRIAVNEELEGLADFFTESIAFLKSGARMVVIAFHSLEDRIVKVAFRRLAGQCVCNRAPELCICPRKALVRLLTRRPVIAGRGEVEINPRARSARLRALERI